MGLGGGMSSTECHSSFLIFQIGKMSCRAVQCIYLGTLYQKHRQTHLQCIGLAHIAVICM